MVRTIRWRREDPLEKRMATHSSVIGVSLVAEMIKNIGEFHELRSLAGYSPYGCKESDMT